MSIAKRENWSLTSTYRLKEEWGGLGNESAGPDTQRIKPQRRRRAGITWSEKTLSGLETGPGLCAVTENRDADRDTRAILCQGYSNTVCCSNKSWHHSPALGVFFACSCTAFLPRHHYETCYHGQVPSSPVPLEHWGHEARGWPQSI